MLIVDVVGILTGVAYLVVYGDMQTFSVGVFVALLAQTLCRDIARLRRS